MRDGGPGTDELEGGSRWCSWANEKRRTTFKGYGDSDNDDHDNKTTRSRRGRSFRARAYGS